MKEASEFRAGNIFKVGNDLLLITKAEYNKGARSASSMKLKTKNLATGSVAETVYRATDKLDDIRLDRRKMQFSYKSGDAFVFMDEKTYEQLELSEEYLGDNVFYLKEQNVIDVLLYNEKPISVELPPMVELTIEYTEPAVQGNTGGKVLKEAKMETGLITNVPIFCHDGDIVKIDTKTGEYLGR
ncbi:MAG: elongation factor P [Candidatus Delongbacteria bacterium]|nr:elongation factor P [Candidatus Delongbacteria bacterium]MCG2759912.1 elongation factor P [Candidatus Delongbacteria bacterium]